MVGFVGDFIVSPVPADPHLDRRALRGAPGGVLPGEEQTGTEPETEGKLISISCLKSANFELETRINENTTVG